jgi:hypothetical protein
MRTELRYGVKVCCINSYGVQLNGVEWGEGDVWLETLKRPLDRPRRWGVINDETGCKEIA